MVPPVESPFKRLAHRFIFMGKLLMVNGMEDIIPMNFLLTPFSSPYKMMFRVLDVVFKSLATVYGSMFPVVASPFKRLAQ